MKDDDCRTQLVEQAGRGLKIDTLGQFSVYQGGDLLTARHGRFNKVWELFLYLITHRNKLTPLDDIYGTLWPDEQWADPKKNIKNLVHRLRKMIDDTASSHNDAVIVYTQGCYRWNSNPDCWLDVEEFELLCGQAEAKSDSSSDSAVGTYKKALELYRGDYLPEFSGLEWVNPARRYYRQLFLNSVLELLKNYKVARKYNEIVRLCERSFLIEQFNEELHLNYLEALLKEGKTAQARAHYQYITSRFCQEFSSKPSEAFQRIYSAIKSKEKYHEFGLEDFKETLKQYEQEEGALLCEADFFTLMCRLESKRARRCNSPLSLAIITLTNHDYRLPPAGELRQGMDKLNHVIMHDLREGDFYSRWNESQYAILFKDMDHNMAENVLRRIKAKADEKNVSNSDIVVRFSVCPLQNGHF